MDGETGGPLEGVRATLVTLYRTTKVWSFTSHRLLKVLHHDFPVVSFGLSQLLLISCCIDGTVTLWNLDSSQPVVKMRTKNGAYIRQLVQSNTKFYGAGR